MHDGVSLGNLGVRSGDEVHFILRNRPAGSIYVKTDNGKTITIDLGEHDTIGFIKYMICVSYIVTIMRQIYIL